MDAPAAPTESEVRSVRSALRLRLKSETPATSTDSLTDFGSGATADSSVAAAAQVELLFERTVQYGENQSGLLLGSVGSDRRAVVIRAMRNLRAKFGNFTVVYLNGVILQNELEAFKELTAQLTRATSVKHPVLSYWNMYEYLRGLLVAKATAGDHVVVVIDALEQFVRENSNAKQLLLYNLLDWLQTKDVKMGVLGITDNYNVVDNLEKRVRSRFSNLQIIVERPSFSQIRQHLVRELSLETFDWDIHRDLQKPSTEYNEAFSKSVNELLLEHSKFLASLEFDYDIGKPQSFFERLTACAIYYLDVDTPLLTARHFQRARHLLEQDHQLAVLETVTEHGIALLIGMGHLEKSDQRVFTLEMVYARWENFLRQHDMLAQLPTRSEAQKALENLLRLKLVKDAGDAFKIGRGGDVSMKQDTSGSLQPEFRAVHLNFAPRTLEGMLRNGSIKCSTLLKEWAINEDDCYAWHFEYEIRRLVHLSSYKELFAAVLAMVVGADLLSDSMKSQGGGVDRNYHILNYVHHSSDVLRKVRLGQPLDTALHCNPSFILHAEQHKFCGAVKPSEESSHPFDLCTSSTLLSGTNFRRERGLQQLKIPRSRQALPLAVPNNSRDTLRKRYLLPPTVSAIPLEKHLDLTYQQHIAPEQDEDHPSESAGSSSASPPELHNAALIIARFFRSVCRLDNAGDRAREVLRQRWREKHPEKYRTPLFELTGNEQLRVLQLYNPHLYGSQHPVSPLKSASISIRLSRVPHMEKHKRLRQSQILARMDQETALLNVTCKQKLRTTVTAATTLHEAYQRQSPSARERPKTTHEREQTRLTEDWVTSTKSPPNLRYRTTQKSHHLFTREIKGIPSLKPLQN